MEELRDAWPDGLEGGDCRFRVAVASTAASKDGCDPAGPCCEPVVWHLSHDLGQWPACP